ncbi:MAG: type II toxin-antitoxin system VapC family toxin [Alphaproteobacteria bacterium]|nr:type II toxin-antitoxin system VapC family toxin [Alphaproteobacteria bacterium]
MIVADANLLVALVIESPNTALAEAVLRKALRWFAPPVWRSEVANILVNYIRRDALRPDSAYRRWERISKILGDGERATDRIRVFELASASGCSAYDCEYAAVAEALGMPLLTFDRKVLRAFPQIAANPAAFLARA